MLAENPASAVQWARVFIRPALKPGSRAVDATAGNGNDTFFLAECVGPGGRVLALDIQEKALLATKERLSRAGFMDRVELALSGHQDMADLAGGPVDAVMFNLGYLPGGDRTVITRPDTTRRGIEAALGLLNPGGRLSVLVYTGHQGARGEAESVGVLTAGLDLKLFNVQKMVFWNARTGSPELYFVTRCGERLS